MLETQTKIKQDVFESRIQRFRQKLEEKNLDTFLVSVGENRRYLTGYTPEDTLFYESAGHILISQDRLIIVTDSRYEMQAKEDVPWAQVFCGHDEFHKELPGLLKQLNTKRLGYESMRMSVLLLEDIRDALNAQKLNNIELVSSGKMIEDLRITKSPDEITSIRNALYQAESLFVALVPKIEINMTEKQIAWMFEEEVRKKFGNKLAFDIIVASGPSAVKPHVVPGNRPVSLNEPILFDWGVCADGYYSDISRTIVLGQPSAQFIRAFNLLKDTQQLAIEAIKPGVSSKSVAELAIKYLKDQGFDEFRFRHGLGHGVGLSVHELPSLSILKDYKIEENMVFTVEPGIYVPNQWGIRLENLVLVRHDGAQVLNDLPMDWHFH